MPVSDAAPAEVTKPMSGENRLIPILVVGLNHIYQLDESLEPSALETAQRRFFVSLIRESVEDFRPTVIADENPDTTNRELLLVYPSNAERICVDIPSDKKDEHGLWIGRGNPPNEILCPDIDALRERYWKRQLLRSCNARPAARVLMLCGANHLYPSVGRALGFPQLLSRAGFSVTSIDLLKTANWDDSWIRDWRDPRPPGAPTFRFSCCVSNGSYTGVCNRRCDRRMMKIQNRKGQ